MFSIRPPLKDLWAFNLSLLASRSNAISATCNYYDIQDVSVRHSRFIKEHRDAAAIDFWRGRHLEDGTLTPLQQSTSPLIYQALVDDEFLPLAEVHCAEKVGKFLSSNFVSFTPPSDCLVDISKNLSFASRSTPAYFLFFPFSPINNVATSRHMRHQNKLSLSLVDL